MCRERRTRTSYLPVKGMMGDGCAVLAQRQMLVKEKVNGVDLLGEGRMIWSKVSQEREQNSAG